MKRTATVFEAKEDDNITIRLDSQLQADVSLADMMCVFHSDVTKILFKMIRGVEDSESQHEQFAGRVQTDRDALRGGRIRLHLSRVTAEDSGSYRCDVAADYDDSLKRWRLETNGKLTPVSLYDWAVATMFRFSSNSDFHPQKILF